MQAKDIMTSPVITIRPEATVHDAASLMLEHEISCLVVVNDVGRVVGILTHSDFGLHRRFMPLSENLYQMLGSWADSNTMEEITHKIRNRLVKDVMSREVAVVAEDAPVAEVVDKMLREHVNRLPVVRGRELIGVITRHDLLKVMVADTGKPEEQLR